MNIGEKRREMPHFFRTIPATVQFAQYNSHSVLRRVRPPQRDSDCSPRRSIAGSRNYGSPQEMTVLRHCLVLMSAIALDATGAWAAEAEPAKVYQKYVVAADHPAASRAGLDVLERGGNVVDAAVATSFALSVVRPDSCGIGGGGFMVIWNAETQTSVAIDYRERAPMKATRDMFVTEDKNGRKLSSRVGGAAAGIPGTVAGLYHAHKKYGHLPWADVVAPAIRLAEQGVLADAHDIEIQQTVLLMLVLQRNARERFAPLYRDYLDSGRLLTTEDRIRSPQAEVLKLIAEQGRDAFYTGPVADALLAAVNEHNGIWVREDLEKMDAVERRPLHEDFAGNTILTMPPPSSGGIALLETLNILAAFERDHPQQQLPSGTPHEAAAVHLVAEALKHAFADRAEFLGDTDFVSVPVARLTSPKYAEQLAAKIDMSRTHSPEAYGRFQGSNDAGTSHFCVLDAEGNAVSCTETINTPFGCLVVEPKFGVVLNNEMDDFAAVPGKPNAFGLIQSEANAVAPRKRPLSSMTPTIVVRDGKAIYALGGSGGPRIISATLQVLLNLTRHGMDVQDAVAAPRFHHQWLPDALFVEQPLNETLSKELQTLGHEVRLQRNIAAVQAATRDENGLRAASDPRKGGQPAGK